MCCHYAYRFGGVYGSSYYGGSKPLYNPLNTLGGDPWIWGGGSLQVLRFTGLRKIRALWYVYRAEKILALWYVSGTFYGAEKNTCTLWKVDHFQFGRFTTQCLAHKAGSDC